MGAVRKVKNSPDISEFITLSHDCCINDGVEDNSEPVILFESNKSKSNDCWKDHEFTHYPKGTLIPASLWDFDWVYNLK